MPAKTKAPSRPAVSPPAGGLWAGPWPTPPRTLEERIQRIKAMGNCINSYVEFMCQVGSVNGTSAEAYERAATAFYERLVVVESQLGRIQEDFRLG